MRIAKIVLGLVIVAYLIGMVAIYLMQGSLLYAPAVERVLPADVGASNIEEVTLSTPAGEKLYSWHAQADADQPTILVFHGSADDISRRLDESIRPFLAHGYGVFILGYPGYGGSDGTPSEEAFIEAALLSYNYLRDSGLEADDIVLYGESLGSAVAVQVAAQEDAKALVLEVPMSSISEIGQILFPYFPMGLIIKDSFRSTDYIADANMPLLIVHGTEDEVIPMSSAQKLFDMANEPKTFHTIEGGTHNNLLDHGLIDIAHSFIEEHSEAKE